MWKRYLLLAHVQPWLGALIRLMSQRTWHGTIVLENVKETPSFVLSIKLVRSGQILQICKIQCSTNKFLGVILAKMISAIYNHQLVTAFNYLLISLIFFPIEEPMTGDHLHKAVGLLEDLQRVQNILENDHVWVDVPDKMGSSPLMVAAQKGNRE